MGHLVELAAQGPLVPVEEVAQRVDQVDRVEQVRVGRPDPLAEVAARANPVQVERPE